MDEPTLFVDIDSTLYDLVPMLCQAALEETGEVSTPEDFDKWHYLKDKYGEKTSHRVFNNALSPHSVGRRKIYPGSHLALVGLRMMGVRIIFCSHNHDPKPMIDPVHYWLSRNFWTGPELIIVNKDVSKVDLLLQYDFPIGIIDDKPKTLLEAVSVNLMAATIRQRWNEEAVREHIEILSFGSWDEVFNVRNPILQDIVERASNMAGWYDYAGGFTDE